MLYLLCARALIAEGGLEFVTMDRLAERTGINKATGYRFFANRDEVLQVVLDEELGRIGDAITRAFLEATPANFAGRLRAVYLVYLAELSAPDGLLAAFLQARRTDDDLGARTRGSVEDSIRVWSLFAVAEFGLERVDADLLAALVISGLEGTVAYAGTTAAHREHAAEVFTAFVVGGFNACR